MWSVRVSCSEYFSIYIQELRDGDVGAGAAAAAVARLILVCSVYSRCLVMYYFIYKFYMLQMRMLTMLESSVDDPCAHHNHMPQRAWMLVSLLLLLLL